jgi:hypothetical protein
MRQQRVKTEIAREMERRPPPPPPPVTDTEPAPPPPTVTETDVASRVPPPVAVWTLFAAGLLAAILVLWRSKPDPAEPETLTPLRAAIPVVLAAAVVGTIALL